MKPEKDFSLSPVTEQLIGAKFEVHNIPGYGFLEIVVELKTDPEYRLVREAQLINEPKGTGIKPGLDKFRAGTGRAHTEGLLKISSVFICS